MPKFNIPKVVVKWKGRGEEVIHDVELIAPFTPNNDKRTKELLKDKLGCDGIGTVHTPITIIK